MKKTFIFLLLLSVFSTLSVKAQESLKADAGENRHFCFEYDWNGTTLGGNPTASGGVTPYTYRWWTNSIYHPIFLDNGATQANPIVAFLADFIAYVEVTDAAESIAIDSIVISVSEMPYSLSGTPPFPIEHSILLGDSVWLEGHNIKIAESYTICSWRTVNGIVSNICDGFWVKPDTTTFYHLEVTDIYGCTERIDYDPIYAVYVDKVGIEDNNMTIPEQIMVFPNPATETLYLSAEVDCEIIDIQGKVLLQSKNAVNFIDISCLKAGAYFVKISNQIIKFVKK